MIQIQNLSFHYKKKLFKDLNLSLEGGNIYGLLGKNGEGKTTMLKLIGGLLHPKMGSCLTMGEEARNRSVTMLQELFFIPEEFELPNVSITTFVKLNSPFYPKFSMTDFKNNMEEFGLSESVKLNSLSFGQKKKFYISFGLAANTKMLLMDEPTNALDIPSKSSFRKLIASSLTDERLILISTHQVRDLESLIDHIVILENNKITLNHSIARISSKMSFGHIESHIPAEDILYCDKNMGLNVGVVKNTDNDDSNVDLELLFNAAITNSKEIINVLNS